MRRAVFSQIGLDSGALGLLGSVVHRFAEPGHYAGTALVGDDARGEFEIVVAEEGPPAAQVDLTGLGRSRRDRCCDEERPAYRVALGGHVAFYVGTGNEGWHVLVGDPRSREAEFDSRRLESGDLFAATVLRPGTYQVRNEHGRERTELVVRYVRPGKERYTPPDPMRLTMSQQASRKAVRVGPAQGIVFEVTDSARILIELVEPDDGPVSKAD